MAVFKRHHRVVKAGHYRAVFENKQRVHGRFFSFHRLPNPLQHHRLGLAVSKKVSKKAVERNRIKRQVRDSFRHFMALTQQENNAVELPDGSGVDIVVVAKPAASGAEAAALRQELSNHWRRLTANQAQSK